MSVTICPSLWRKKEELNQDVERKGKFDPHSFQYMSWSRHRTVDFVVFLLGWIQIPKLIGETYLEHVSVHLHSIFPKPPIRVILLCVLSKYFCIEMDYRSVYPNAKPSGDPLSCNATPSRWNNPWQRQTNAGVNSHTLLTACDEIWELSGFGIFYSREAQLPGFRGFINFLGKSGVDNGIA